MDQEAPSICLVANDLYSLNRCAGIGSYFWRLAHLLARAGWRTHLLYCAKADDREALRGVNSRLAESGIRFLNLDECDCPNDPPLLKPLDEPWFLVRSERVRRVLEGLHRVHCYDLIEFADWQATGFRSVQARRAGSAFTDARLIVKMHGPSDWRREQNGHWKNGIEDSQLDYCERYAFEHADVQLAASESVLTYCRSR